MTETTQTEDGQITGATTVTESYPCQCHTPPQSLFQRVDLGMADPEHPRFALCVLKAPGGVHEWNGERYECKPGLRLVDGDKVMDEQGDVLIQSAEEQGEERPQTIEDILTIGDDGDDEQRPEAPRRRRGEDGDTPAVGQPPRRTGERVNLRRDQWWL